MKRTIASSMLAAIVATLVLVSGAVWGVGAQQKMSRTKCKIVSGHIMDQSYTGAECASPLGQCSAGRFYGGLKGNFIASATSFTPSNDTAKTGVVFFTASLVLHTKEGDIFLKDAGAFNTTSGD